MSAGVDTSSSGGGDKGKVRAKKMTLNVDMAPMCDLGFLLITFFMFTTTFSKPNIMHLNMPPKIDIPNDQKPEIKIKNSFTVILGKEDKVYWHQLEQEDLNSSTLNETNYSKDGIRKEILRAQKEADQDKFTVIIKPTDDANYKNLVDILDEMEITHSERYGIKDLSSKEVEVYQEKTK
ncbi:MAG: biopolymer transporter ExbD [Flavobacteriaceae bacterium]|jgi:biopolymer transport protein ExbD|nr:biopolymer transporter ExbD [Flavobacteriaceae bacterium]